MEWGSSLPHSQEFATWHCPEPVQSSHSPIPLLWCPLLFGPPIYATVFQLISFPRVSTPKPYLYLTSPPHMLQSPFISCFFSLSSEWYLVRSAVHKAPRYVVISTPPLPRTSPDILEKFAIDISVVVNWGTVSFFESGHKSSVLRKLGKLSWDEIRLNIYVSAGVKILEQPFVMMPGIPQIRTDF